MPRFYFPASHSRRPASVASEAVRICALSVSNHVALTGGRVTVSLAALQMGLSPLNVGLLVAVFAILPMLTSVHAGR